MKTILCFGDSNTFGFNPRTEKRYSRSIRWPYVLQKILGDSYEVISEGFVGRTLASEDSTRPYYNGSKHIQALLKSHDPIGLVIITLGTNEIKDRYKLNAKGIAKNLEKVILLIRDKKLGLEKSPKVLIVCPPPPAVPASGKVRVDMKRAPEIFKVLPTLYKEVARKYKCDYLNAGDYVSSGKFDGYHFDPEGHLGLAKVFAVRIKKMKI